MKLDIGNTMWPDGEPIEEAGWTCIDPANAVTLDDEDGKIAGDMNRMPFADNSFTHVFGSCYFEGSDLPGDEDQYDLRELARVLMPGGDALLTSCASWTISSAKQVDMMFRDLTNLYRAITESGLRIVSIECRDIYDDNNVSYPLVTLRKESL